MAAHAKGVHPTELHERLASGEKLVLLDVREHDELRICSLPGHTHIPMNDVPRRMAELDPGATTVVYCHSGRRSQMVANYLIAQGFKDVANLSGGIDLWAAVVDPSIARY